MTNQNNEATARRRLVASVPLESRGLFAGITMIEALELIDEDVKIYAAALLRALGIPDATPCCKIRSVTT